MVVFSSLPEDCPPPDTDSFSDDDGFAGLVLPPSVFPHAANENARSAARGMHKNVFFILIFSSLLPAGFEADL